jgi:hypothetical protein
MLQSAIALLLLTVARGHAASAPRMATDVQGVPPTVEDAEILRQLLVEAVDGAESTATDPHRATAGSADAVPARLLLGGTRFSFGGSPSVTHSRAFHVPGTGLLLALDVQVAVAFVDEGSPAAEEPAPADDWERVRRELKGGATEGDAGALPLVLDQVILLRRLERLSARGASVTRPVLDPRTIDAVTEAVLATLERYGARVRGLDPGERITVALHLSPAVSDSTSRLSLTLSGGARRWGSLGGDGESGSEQFPVLTPGEAAPQRLIVQIAARDLATASGAAGGAELRRRALVHRY